MTITNALRGVFAAMMIVGAMTVGGSTGMAAENSASKPNILFILVDDLGKEWISCYGAEDIKTPNIDALAKGGMKFHNVYSLPQCTPPARRC
jgi:arylsulfatase A-like enzyme